MSRIREHDHLTLVKLPGVTEQVKKALFREKKKIFVTLSPPFLPKE